MALAAVLALTLVAGCSSSASKTVVPVSSTTTTIPHITLPPYPIPGAGAIPDDPAAHKLVAITSCVPNAGGWMAAGTVKNPGTAAATYALTIFFEAGGRTLNYAQTTVIVEPRSSAPWFVTRHFEAPRATKCALRGVGVS